MIRRLCFDKMGGYFDKRLRQLNDLEAHIRLCLYYDIHIIQEPFVLFRVRANEANTSGRSMSNYNSGSWEMHHILALYLKISEVQELLQIFPDLASQYQVLD